MMHDHVSNEVMMEKERCGAIPGATRIQSSMNHAQKDSYNPINLSFSHT